jgi:hypothetical protein
MLRSAYVRDTLEGARYRLITEAFLNDLYQLEILALLPQESGEADAILYEREVNEAAARLASFFGMASPGSVLALPRSEFKLNPDEVAEMKRLKATMGPALGVSRGQMREVLRYRLLMLRIRQLAT